MSLSEDCIIGNKQHENPPVFSSSRSGAGNERRAERLYVSSQGVRTGEFSTTVETRIQRPTKMTLGDMLPKARGKHVLAAAPAPGTYAAVAVVGDSDVVVLPEVARYTRGGSVFDRNGAAPVAPLTAYTSSGRLSSMSGGTVVIVRSGVVCVARSIGGRRDGSSRAGVTRRASRETQACHRGDPARFV